MTPKRWEQVSQIYQAALGREPNEREAFLDQACAGDEGLRREVESLVAYQEQAESFLSSPALEAVARGIGADPTGLPIGSDLGHYQILSRLGEGGMGVVYKARDKNLGRSVALKVLAAGLVADPEHRKRLVLEARTASALNHPNIITVYEIANDRGIDFIVMEHVAGKTLDELIPRRGLPLKEALTYAIQIADGLATAHAVGIIHRDLKPGNVMVSQSGLVKVLDFGLAKLAVVAGSQGSELTTMPVPSGIAKTEEGTLQGTVSYMSPEQAEGKNVDARSDIFSFGLVLYEMVTGQRAFTGESNLAILTAILREEPKPASQIVKAIPYDLEKIINRCLRKERERRSQTMGDVKIALQEVKAELDSGRQIPVATPQQGHQSLRWIILLLAILGIGAIALWLGRTTTQVPQTSLRPVPLTSYPGFEAAPAFSPDGNQVAFLANKDQSDNFDIYVKLIGSSEPLRLTRDPAAEFSPAWSPDGRQIAFLQKLPGGKATVMLMSALGGPASKLTEIQTVAFADLWTNPFSTYLAWSADGSSLVIVDKPSATEPFSLFSFSLGTREKRRLTFPAPKSIGDTNPAFSPEGGTLAFIRLVNFGGTANLHLLSLSGNREPVGEPKQLTSTPAGFTSATWTPDGQALVFASSSDFSSVGSSLSRIALIGARIPEPLVFPGEDNCSPVISRQGQRLVYVQRLIRENIWRVEVPTSQGKASRPVSFIATTRNDGNPDYSPDGKKIAFASDRSGSYQIWVCDSDGSNAVPLTSFDAPVNASPRWSPDGERIAFNSNKEGEYEVYTVRANGGQPLQLTSPPSGNGSPNWSRDGKWIYFTSNRSGENQIWKMPADGGEAIRVTQDGGVEAFESPDGTSVYYTKEGDKTMLGGLWKVPVGGGKGVQVLETVLTRTFAVGNKGIYFCAAREASVGSSIRFFDFATGRISQIAITERQVSIGLSVSPDERWVLYSQFDQLGSDLMLVENFR